MGYLDDGRLFPDNVAENAIRLFVNSRKNWLLGGTRPKELQPVLFFFSFVKTSKANTLEPHAYLRFIFEKLPAAITLEEYEALLPWNGKMSLI